MAIGTLNNESFSILLKQGTDANLKLSTTFLQQGEPAYTTDSRKLYIVDGSNNKLTVPVGQAVVDLTAQTAAIGATTLYAVPAGGGGAYRISWTAKITTVASTGAATSTLGGANGFQILATSPTDSVVGTYPKTSVAGVTNDTSNTTATGLSGSIVVFAKASTNIQYQMDYTSNTAAQMAFELHIRLEAI